MDRCGAIDKTAPLTKYLKLINPYSRKQSSIITQFRMNHAPLNLTLFCIGHAESPACPHCGGITVESLHDFILDCPHHALTRHKLHRKLGRILGEILFLLGNRTGVKEFLNYVHSTRRFKQ